MRAGLLFRNLQKSAPNLSGPLGGAIHDLSGPLGHKIFSQFLEWRPSRVCNQHKAHTRTPGPENESFEGKDHIVPKADIGTYQDVTSRKMFFVDAVEAPPHKPGFHAVDFPMQTQKGQHLRINVDPSDQGTMFFGAVDACQSPAAPHFHDPGICMKPPSPEIFHEQPTGCPGLVSVCARNIPVLEPSHLRVP